MSNEQTVFGIDLGTTYSCIAYVDDYGRPVVVPNGDGLLTTASVVELGSTVVVGEEAKKNAVLSPDAVVSMVKRHMGEENWRFSYQGQEYTAEQISSFILKKVVEDAKNSVGHDITRVVITCPAYFGVNEREATAIAGRIAGLDVLEIINEPTAAAISYSMEKPDQQPPDQVALVYDLGGGTFDVTVIEIKSGAITVIATGGDHRLGGRDWDEEVVKYLSAQFMAETSSFDDPMNTPETLQDLWIQAEAAKRALTARTDTIARVTAQGQSAAIPLTRDKFDELTAALLARTVEYTRSTLADAAKKGYSRFDTLLLVGGSSKMPQVKERLQREFGVEPRLFDPDQAVAKGAALYGFKLSIGQRIESLQESGMSEAQAQQTVASDMGVQSKFVGQMQNTSIRNVISHSFGIVAQNDAGRELIANLVLRQAPLPATEDQRFGTVSANQSSVHIRIMENDMSDADVMDVTVGKELGSADLPLPPGLPAGAPIDVHFEINTQGRLEMTAREPSSGRTINAVIETSAVMSEDEINKATQLARMTPVR